MQVHLDERFRARVTSIFLTGLIVAIPVGALLGGAIGDSVGLEVTARFFALMLALYALIARIGLRGLRALDGDGPAAPARPHD
jgi:predicted MFS family arabinose efflux permease